MLNRQPIVFNQAAIQAWDLERKDLPNQIEMRRLQKQPHYAALKELEPALRLAKEQLRPWDASISAVESSLSSLQTIQAIDTLQHLAESDETRRRRGFVGNVVESISDAHRNYQISQLNTQLIDLRYQRAPYAAEKQRLENEFYSHQSEISALERRIHQYQSRREELTQLISEATHFLNQLTLTPQNLFSELATNLLNNLKDYNKSHPSKQSVPIRICLIELGNKIRLIQEQQLSENPEGLSSNNAKNWQLKYAELCGLLWHTLDRLKGDENAEFAALIHSALLSTHIAKDGDLPDALRLNLGCVSLYHQLQNPVNPRGFQDMEETDLHTLEESEYKAALAALRNAIRKTPQTNKELIDFVKQGKEVADFIETEKNKPIKPGEPSHDLKFYTQILNETKELALKPSRSDLRANYKKLANLTEGIPSLGKKLGGLMLAFLGAVIIVSATFTALASFGAASPLSAMSISVGATVLAKGMSIGIGVVGLGTLAGGLGIFKNGLRKGMSKKIMGFAKSAEKINTDPQPIAEVLAPLAPLMDGEQLPPPYQAPGIEVSELPLPPPYAGPGIQASAPPLPEVYNPPQATNPGYEAEGEEHEPGLAYSFQCR